jgi:hypothetical protein
MASRSGPLGEGRAARAGAIAGAWLYTIGAVAGGCVLAGTLSTIGSVLGEQSTRSLIAGSAATILLITAALGRRLRLPQRRWQVPQSWFVRLGRLAMLPAGFTLSLGFVTPIWAPTYYVLVLSYLAMSPTAALVIGAIYGLMRSSRNWKGAFQSPGLGIDSKQLRVIGNVYAQSFPAIVIGLSGIAVAALFEAVIQ